MHDLVANGLVYQARSVALTQNAKKKYKEKKY